jgi:hypothetical protein
VERLLGARRHDVEDLPKPALRASKGPRVSGPGRANEPCPCQEQAVCSEAGGV